MWAIMDYSELKSIVVEQKKQLDNIPVGIERELLAKVSRYFETPHIVILSGMRRTGKSTLQKQIQQAHFKSSEYFFNFEDERLLNFTVSDFNKLYEVFVELYGQQNIFFLDEIQNIPNWEMFIRRMQDKGFKFFITGSNASLLSRELGTKLTGRHITLTLYPFSFLEYLSFKGFKFEIDMLLQTQYRGIIKNHFQEYLQNGGLPEYLQYQDSSLLKRTYEDILYRDIITRYDINSVKAFRELCLYLLSNIGTLVSYRKLAATLEIGSVTTVKNYLEYLENSFLFFTLQKYSPSLKKQNIANKKIYCLDNGLIEAIAFQFSKNSGHYLENLVYIELRRREKEIYYYQTKNSLEVDFVVRQGREIVELIQVCEGFHQPATRKREISALLAALEETNIAQGLILTLDHQEEIKLEGKTIIVTPIYQWLLK